MKKKYLSILALSMALTTSCNFLDVMPTNWEPLNMHSVIR